MRLATKAHRAYSLIELMVVTGLAVMVGGIAYTILNAGLILFSENTATNVAHQQARMAMLQMQKEMHQSISPTRLVDENGSPVNSDGPAAGISFLVFAKGPFEVTAKAADKQNKITMNLKGYLAKAGQRLVIANHNLELDLAADSPGGNNQVLTLVGNLDYPIEISGLDDHDIAQPKPVYGILTERITFRVKDEELIWTDRNGKETVLARDITSDKPFGRSSKGNSETNPRFIATINLASGSKGKGKKRGRKYSSTSLILNAEVPARAILCNKP